MYCMCMHTYDTLHKCACMFMIIVHNLQGFAKCISIFICDTTTCSLFSNYNIHDAGLKVLIDALLVNCKHVKDIK